MSNKMPWIKLSVKMPEDAGLRLLSDNAYRVWVQALATAGNLEATSKRGTLEIDDVVAAKYIAKSMEEIVSAVEEFETYRLPVTVALHERYTGVTVTFQRWEKYQKDIEKAKSNERVKKHRNNKKKEV